MTFYVFDDFRETDILYLACDGDDKQLTLDQVMSSLAQY